MGLEAKAAAKWNGAASAPGKLQLETAELLFRGDFRLKIPLAAIQSVEARCGWLEVRAAEGSGSFELGFAAAKWADKILHPPSRIGKLGVKPGMRVSIMGEMDEDFLAELPAGAGTKRKDSDILFLRIEGTEDLRQVITLGKYLAPKGAIWAIYPKGQKHLKESHVRTVFRDAGYIDVKVAAFSATHTSLKFIARKLEN